MLFEDERPRKVGIAEVGYRHSTSVLNKGVGALAGVDFTLNPYIGCQFGCSYCYAAFFHPDEDRIRRWGKWVDVKENALQLIQRSRNLGAKTILIGSATDPYQPIEAKLRITRSILEWLVTLRPQARPIILTRSPLIERDLELFAQFESLKVSMSITTDDDEVRKAFEPGCASISRRVEAATRAAAAGVDVGASLCPLLPMRDPEGFVRDLASRGIRHIWTGTFHEGSRPFAAGTGKAAYEIAKALDWTKDAAENTVARIKAEGARLGVYGRGE